MDCAGAHLRHHDDDYLETTTNVKYAPVINSISQLIKATIKLPEETYQNNFGVDYYLPRPSTVLLQPSLGGPYQPKLDFG